VKQRLNLRQVFEHVPFGTRRSPLCLAGRQHHLWPGHDQLSLRLITALPGQVQHSHIPCGHTYLPQFPGQSLSVVTVGARQGTQIL